MTRLSIPFRNHSHASSPTVQKKMQNEKLRGIVVTVLVTGNMVRIIHRPGDQESSCCPCPDFAGKTGLQSRAVGQEDKDVMRERNRNINCFRSCVSDGRTRCGHLFAFRSAFSLPVRALENEAVSRSAAGDERSFHLIIPCVCRSGRQVKRRSSEESLECKHERVTLGLTSNPLSSDSLM